MATDEDLRGLELRAFGEEFLAIGHEGEIGLVVAEETPGGLPFSAAPCSVNADGHGEIGLGGREIGEGERRRESNDQRRVAQEGGKGLGHHGWNDTGISGSKAGLRGLRIDDLDELSDEGELAFGKARVAHDWAANGQRF